MAAHSFLSPQYINGIYIPSGLLLVGIAIVKKEWLPYAITVAIVLGSWKIYSNRQSNSQLHLPSRVDLPGHIRSEEMSQSRGVSRVPSQRENHNLA